MPCWEITGRDGAVPAQAPPMASKTWLWSSLYTSKLPGAETDRKHSLALAAPEAS